MARLSLFLLSLLIFALASCITCRNAASSLPSLNADVSRSTVSGLSSGAYMAVQMHVAYSSVIIGSGIFAGGPYNCAGGSATAALSTCMKGKNPVPDVSTYVSETLQRGVDGSIDDPANLGDDQVYLFSGTLDTTVYPAVMDSLNSYYNYFLTSNSSSQLYYENTMQAQHTQPTDIEPNNACNVSKTPYISFCNYDGAGKALNHLFANLQPKATGDLEGRVLEFDQTPFVPQGMTVDSISLAETGYVYVPKACNEGYACVVHVAFHGCEQSSEFVGTDYVLDTGYNEWADTNNIVVLYPQTVKSVLLGNPYGCWNWWGYVSNPDTYDTQQGYQMQTIRTMLGHLTAAFVGLPAPTEPTVTSVGNTTVSLAWTGVDDATSYNVYCDEQQKNALPITCGISCSYTVTGLASGTFYTFTVSAVYNEGEESQPSPSVSATTEGPAPPLTAPTGLTVTSTTSSAVSLAWDGVSGAESYGVFRDSSLVGNTSNHFYTDTGLDADTTYHYQVAAFSDTQGQGPLSSAVAAVTLSSFQCETYTSNNFQHVSQGRAYVSLGSCYAVGSEDYMGLYNIFVYSTLAETDPNYYEVGSCPNSRRHLH